jgi:histidine triad (HIT) family protein
MQERCKMSGENPKDCIFCRIASREIPANLEYEDEWVVAFKDIHPQAPIHTLILPKIHIPQIGEITEANGEILVRLISVANRLARQYGIDEEGYRLVLNSGDNGGQTVYHVHVHLLGGRFMRWPPG